MRKRTPKTTRQDKKLFVICCEGEKTEPNYFSLFRRINKTITIVLQKAKHSSPGYLINHLKKYCEDNIIKEKDELWIVCDRDKWDLENLYKWSNTKNHHVALSNPKFELWILLHFEKIGYAITADDCDKKVKTHIKNYNKAMPFNRIITETMIRDAINNAKTISSNDLNDCANTRGRTTVYHLVEKLMVTNHW